MTPRLLITWLTGYFKPTVETHCSEEKIPFRWWLPASTHGCPRAQRGTHTETQAAPHLPTQQPHFSAWTKQSFQPSRHYVRSTFPTAIIPIRKLPQAPYPYPLQGRQNENHNHRKLTKLIPWITALSNSMKLWAMPYRATQDRQVMVECSDKTWSIEEENGKPLQYSCLENPKTSMKRQKDRTLKDELPRLVGAQ